MRVRMRSRAAGPRGVVQPGMTMDVSEETARLMVLGGYAEYVDEPGSPFLSSSPPSCGEVEEARVKPEETAVKRPRKRRARSVKEEVDGEG